MRWRNLVTVVEAHAEGEIGRVVTGGLPRFPGSGPLDALRHLNEVDDGLRRFLVLEPRGFAQMSTNLLLPPTNPNADAAFIILQSDKAHAMSGSNSICVTTVLLETGMVEMREPETVVTLETAAGLVTARAECKNGKCERVTLDMVPSFVDRLDVPLEIEGIGAVTVDIAFGGVFYALVEASSLGVPILPDRARTLVDLGSRIHRAANRRLDVRHPEIEGIGGISYVMIVDRKPDTGELVGATILPPGRIDRSPCGTGNAARAAVMHARGQKGVGDRYTARSIIDSRFDVEIAGTLEVAGRPAVRTRIGGRGWIHGLLQMGRDPSDPFDQGHLLTDCWGDATDLLG